MFTEARTWVKRQIWRKGSGFGFACCLALEFFTLKLMFQLGFELFLELFLQTVYCGVLLEKKAGRDVS